MSKIHEALRRAERERASRPNPEVAPTLPELAEAPTPQRDNTLPVLTQDNFAAASPEPDYGFDQLTPEALKQQVRKPKWNPNPKTMLFFGTQSYALGTEEFRTLRSRLYEFRDMQSLKTLLVTSGSPQEGKTFIAANLAQIFVRQPGRSALLIDADLRWSRLHLSLGTYSTPGLSDYLRGEANEFSIIQQGPLDNLFFIPGGKHASNPAELIANGRLKGLLQRLSPLFDWIVVDSPPVLAVSDARVISDLCDGVLMVVAAGIAAFDITQKARQELQNKRLLGVVLNRAEPRLTYSYNYYGYYRGPEKNGNGKG